MMYIKEEETKETAKFFMTGRRQIVCIPKQYWFNTNEIFINKIGNAIVLISKEDLAKEYRKRIEMLREEF